jgi:predicted GNAT family acetyltransferase
MRVVRFDSVATFVERVTPVLLEREAENCFTLGRLSELAGTAADDPPPSMWAVESDDGQVLATATMSSGLHSGRQRPVVVTRASRAVIDALVGHFLETGVSPPGVTATDPTVGEFAAAWCARTGQGQRLVHALGLYHLTHVLPPTRQAPGTFRPARDKDSETLKRWAHEFFRELGEPESPDFCRRVAADRIREGRAFFWCDNGPLAMAGWGGRTPNGVRIDFVYTPPPNRGRGYASACVAALTRRLLDEGRRFCFLFTDLANPTSNRIYRAIGYEHLGNFKHVHFG